MRPEVQAWLDAAAADERAVDTLEAAGNHALAVFHAQQAAEKHLKAACVRLRRSAHTHSLLQLLDEIGRLGRAVPEPVLEAARRLEAHYTAARHPNGLGPSPGPLYDAKLVTGNLRDLSFIAGLSARAPAYREPRNRGRTASGARRGPTWALPRVGS